MPKTLNHISTLAVSGRRCDNPKNLFTEADFHESMECPNVYVRNQIRGGKAPGVPPCSPGHAVRIFRPGFIMGDSKTGRFKKHITSDAQYLHLQGHIFMRTAPPLYDDDYMDLTPVDYAAAAIVHIAFQPDTPPGTYHVCNPQPILKSQIWDIIRDYGFPVRTVPAERYLEEVLDSDDELFLRGLQSVIVYLGDYEKSPAIFDASETLRRLKGSGISCPPPRSPPCCAAIWTIASTSASRHIPQRLAGLNGHERFVFFRFSRGCPHSWLGHWFNKCRCGPSRRVGDAPVQPVCPSSRTAG